MQKGHRSSIGGGLIDGKATNHPLSTTTLSRRRQKLEKEFPYCLMGRLLVYGLLNFKFCTFRPIEPMMSCQFRSSKAVSFLYKQESKASESRPRKKEDEREEQETKEDEREDEDEKTRYVM